MKLKIDLQMDVRYGEWLKQVSREFRNSQIKAAVKVNTEMLKFYYFLGSKISELKNGYIVGNEFYMQLSKDLQRILPDVKSFSPTNIKYMQYFFTLYSSPQAADSKKCKLFSPQVVDLEMSIFQIPWGHHRIIIDKCGNDKDEALFYVHETIANNWSRAVLLNFLDSDLYSRQGRAISNFHAKLGEVTGDLAQAITKDPYNFGFLTIQPQYNEKQLKDALMINIQRFLLELGTGFSFVGREYRLEVGKTEQFIDMLFYHIPLHCYVVVEVKIREFEPADMGQISTYVNAVDGLLKKEGDSPTIGILICKSKDNILAKYALAGTAAPIGISEYQLGKLLSETVARQMPTIDEIENGLR